MPRQWQAVGTCFHFRISRRKKRQPTKGSRGAGTLIQKPDMTNINISLWHPMHGFWKAEKWLQFWTLQPSLYNQQELSLRLSSILNDTASEVCSSVTLSLAVVGNNWAKIGRRSELKKKRQSTVVQEEMSTVDQAKRATLMAIEHRHTVNRTWLDTKRHFHWV